MCLSCIGSCCLSAQQNQPVPEFLSHRLQCLEAYIQQLVNTDRFQCDELYTFLELNNPSREISFGTIQAASTGPAGAALIPAVVPSSLPPDARLLV